MESPLLTTNDHEKHIIINSDSSSDDEHNVDTTMNREDSASNDEHNMAIAIHGDSSSTDEHNVDIAISSDSSSTPHKARDARWRNPCTLTCCWGLINCALALVQIVAAIVVLSHSKDEHPKTALRVWIIGYTCGCIVTLLPPLLNCGWSSIGNKEELVVLYMVLEYFFLSWAALLLWIDANSSSIYDNSQHFWLCMAFLAFICIRYVPTHLIWTAICLIIIMMFWITAYIMDMNPDTMIFYIIIDLIVDNIEDIIKWIFGID